MTFTATTFPAADATTLTEGQVTTALDMHGVQHHTTTDGVVWAWEEATIRGLDGVVRDASAWVKVPTGKAALMAWLGY